MYASSLAVLIVPFLLGEIAYVLADFQLAGCLEEGCGIPCYLRPPEDQCHYTEHSPCDAGGATILEDQLELLNNSLVRLQEKLIQKGIIPSGGTCKPLNIIENGGVIYSDLLLSIGVIANYVCKEGYSLHGHGRYECSVDKVWIGEDSEAIDETKKPTCEESLVICEALVPIPYGHISYHIVDTAIVQPGDVASYSCDEMFILQGNQHRICLRNGTWSGMEPECIAPASQRTANSTEVGSNPGWKVAFGVSVVVVVVIAVLLLAVIITRTLVRLRKRKNKGYQAMSEDEPDKSILKGSESKQETDSEIITLQAEHT